MAEEKTIIKLVGLNNGLSIKPNGLVEVKIEADGEQLIKALTLLQIAGHEFKVGTVFDGEKAVFGKFGFYAMKIDRDGCSTITLRSDIEAVNIENIKRLYAEQEVVLFTFISAISAQ